MCGITGWVKWTKDLSEHRSILDSMTQTLSARGPDDTGTWVSRHCGLGHKRLSVIDPENGKQPMCREMGDTTYVIVYNGELYNSRELRQQLEQNGHRFYTRCDTEVLLLSFIEWGEHCVEKLNGIFAFAVWNEKEQSLFLARDRLGVKPLFYVWDKGNFLFGSEPKAILAHPDFQPIVEADGLAEILALGPARTPGHGIYRNMSELKPGYYMVCDRDGLRYAPYWKLQALPHPDDAESTAQNIRSLLEDIVERQLVSDVPVCTLLSGGLDSSALTAIAANYYRDTGKGVLHTYSLDYRENEKYFQPNAFQPDSDGPWIRRMVEFLGTQHHQIVIDTPELVEALREAVLAKDYPGMADIDSSLYLFCREIKKGATVALSGEAADEIFGGYPWFYREEALTAETFPWALTLNERVRILSRDIIDWIRPEQYVRERYRQALSEVPHLAGEDGKKRRLREISYLNITRFMQTLLDRKDRMSMAVGLEVRVPYCDHRLVEYVFNIPWEMKTYGGREKGILRKALEGILPHDVLYRKKSPYPKTHHPHYLRSVRERLLNIVHDPSSPLVPLVNMEALRSLIVASSSDEKKTNLPFFGQLMNVPQVFAFLIQVDIWLREYRISFR